MIQRLIFALLSLPCAALAQLKLFTFDGTAELPVGALYEMGSTATGDTAETRFRVRNTGSSAVAIQTIQPLGTGFSLSSGPSLPYTLAPTAAVDFRVKFQPALPGSYSANLTVNDISAILHATGVAAAAVALDTASGRMMLSSGTAIDFGRVQKGSAATKTFEIGNTGSGKLTVSSVTVTGDAFRGTGPATPVDLAPGQWIPFQITFAPSAPTSQQGTLAVDGRTFALTGVGFNPPLPTPTLVFSTPLPASAQQPRVSIQFATPSQVAAAGTLRILFLSSITGIISDPAVRFVATGSTSASFQVQEGDTSARFGSQADVTFQTGTTAGSILFFLDINGQTTQNPIWTLTITPAPVTIDSAIGTRRVSDLDVEIVGFDNTYTAGAMSFTFFDQNGNAVPPGAIQADAATDFKSYFKTSTAGSTFALRATFQVTGDVTRISGVEVEMTNSGGKARTNRISF